MKYDKKDKHMNQPKRTHGTENLYMKNEINCNYVPPMVDTKIMPIEKHYGVKMADSAHLGTNPSGKITRHRGIK